MSVPAFLLEFLVCPETRQRLRALEEPVLRELNGHIENKSLRDAGGRVLSRPLEDGLIRQDGRVVYPVWEGVPYMRPDHAIPIIEVDSPQLAV